MTTESRMGNDSTRTDVSDEVADSATGAELYRSVAGVHLGMAGLVNVVSGLGLVWVSLDGRLLRFVYGSLLDYMSPEQLLQQAELLRTIGVEVAPLVSLAFLVIGVLQINTGRNILRGNGGNGFVIAAGFVNPLTFPLVVITALVLAIEARVL